MKDDEENDQKTYQSPVTGQTITVYPTEEDWERLLKEAGKTGPHWD